MRTQKLQKSTYLKAFQQLFSPQVSKMGVNEIYVFRKSGKFHDAKQKYNEIY